MFILLQGEYTAADIENWNTDHILQKNEQDQDEKSHNEVDGVENSSKEEESEEEAEEEEEEEEGEEKEEGEEEEEIVPHSEAIKKSFR